MLDELKAQIRALFPIGSEWYDCLRGEVGTVVFHFPPRGIALVRRFTATHIPVLAPEKQRTLWDSVRKYWTLNAHDVDRQPETRDHVEIMLYGYSELLDGRLVEPARDLESARELFEGYRKRRDEINREFERMREEAGLADAECWGHPVG